MINMLKPDRLNDQAHIPLLRGERDAYKTQEFKKAGLTITSSVVPTVSFVCILLLGWADGKCVIVQACQSAHRGIPNNYVGS